MATFEALTNQMGEMKLSVEGLEKERDFYFNKVCFLFGRPRPEKRS